MGADYSSQLDQIITLLNQLQTSMSQQLINAISAVGSVLAALAGLWAAHSARRAAINIEKVARLGILRNLIGVAHDVINESKLAISLVEEVKTQIRDLARFTGNPAGSVETEVIRKAEARGQEVIRLQGEGDRLLETRALLKDKPEETLTQELSRFEGYLSEIKRLTHDLQREADSYATRNAVYFSKTVGP